MEKIDNMSLNIVNNNINKLMELFPECIKDGQIDFDILKQLLGSHIEDSGESYSFNWHGKMSSIKNAITPSTMTLLPCIEKSLNWSESNNIFIEGDNLEALKILSKTYHGKIKMIYIDPPYNTGNDFVYHDNFNQSISDYKDNSIQNFKSNPEYSGRFHTDWLNMIYPRIKLANELLKEDGVLYISIDDNELPNLIKVCNMIFGENNLINIICVKTNETKGLKNSNVDKGFPKNKEYLLIYAKNKDFMRFNIVKVQKSDDELKKYMRYYNKYIDNIDEDCSKWKISDFNKIVYGKSDDEVFNLKFNHKNKLIYLVTPDNVNEDKIPTECCRFYKILNNKNEEHYYYRDEESKIYTVLFLSDNISKNLGDLWTDISTININKETCGLPTYSNGQKPIKLLERLIAYSTNSNSNDIVLDFFAGSSTTACAVLNCNKNDNGNRKFIMVQLPENIDDNLKIATDKKPIEKIIQYLDSNDLPHYITDFSESRIKATCKHLMTDSNDNNIFNYFENNDLNLDYGFKVFKIESTNIKQWDPTIKYDSDSILLLEDVFKDGRTDLDVVYEIMLKYGIFNMPLEEVAVNDKKIYSIGYNYMIIMLDNDINPNDISEIAKLSPKVVVFKETGFDNDNDKINAEYTLKRFGVDDVKCI